MSNQELADAIAFAFSCCELTYIGGQTNRESVAGQLMLAHLKNLLVVQLERTT